MTSADCGQLRLTAENVVIETPDSDPLNLVEIAIERRRERETLAKQQKAVAYDQIWVVCDRERQHHHRFPRLQEAVAMARANNIHIALSVPCFEYWLLLHHHQHTAALPDCSAVEAQLNAAQNSNGLPAYEKATYPLAFYVTRQRVNDACDRARGMRKRHADTHPAEPPRFWTRDYIEHFVGANQPDGNPCTDVDELVRQFNLAANPRLRFVHYQNLPSAPFQSQ
jgi:hypothetical protein